MRKRDVVILGPIRTRRTRMTTTARHYLQQIPLSAQWWRWI